MHEIHFLDSTTKYKTFHFFTKVNYKIELLFENKNKIEISQTTSHTFTLNLCGSSCPSYISQHSLLARKEFCTNPSLSLNASNFPFSKGLVRISATYLICGNILELHCSLLNLVSYEVIYDLYMLGPVMKHWILKEFDTTLIITVNDCGIQLLIKQSCK
jgi:hypothetical protein